MKLQASVDEEILEFELKLDGDTVTATVDGRQYELDVSRPEPNVLLFKHKGKVVEAFTAPQGEPGKPVNVTIGGRTYAVGLIDPKRLRGSASGSEHAGGTAELRTAMPGKVVRIIAATGTEVAKGDGVLVVEAMKMQNELKAPKAGVLKEIRVSEGATVAAGDVLAVIE